MRRLLVLYDSACPFCERCRHWLQARPSWVHIEAACCRSPEVRSRFGHIDGLGRELVVVADDGRYWVGPPAFSMCLWALSDWTELAELASSGWLWWLTRRAFAFVSEHRALLGRLGGVECHDDRCALPAASGPYR